MRVKTLARTMSETLRAARVGHVVGLALGDPLGDLGVGQACRQCCSDVIG